jgi:(2Fe-2S) ferredoxin
VAQRKRYLFVCVNRRPLGTAKGSCATRDAEALHAELKAACTARGLSTTEVRTCTASCLDVCWAGPAIAVMPDNVMMGRVTRADIPEIVDALARGELVDRLILPASDYEVATAGPALPETPPPGAAPPGGVPRA